VLAAGWRVRWHLDPAEVGLERAVLAEGPALLAQGGDIRLGGRRTCRRRQIRVKCCEPRLRATCFLDEFGETTLFVRDGFAKLAFPELVGRIGPLHRTKTASEPWL